MTCLGYRTSGYLLHVMGRETMLAPVCWDEGGWPIVNGDGTLMVNMDCATLTQVAMPKEPEREEFNYIYRNVPSDSYHSLGLPMGWMSIGNPELSCYSLKDRKGWLRLYPTSQTLDAPQSPTFVARRQTEMKFEATAKLDVSHLTEGTQVGITAYAAPLNHYDVLVEKRNGKLFASSNIRIGEVSHRGEEIALTDNMAYLRITSDKDYYYLQASIDGVGFETLAKMDFRYLSSEVIGGFTGVMLGVYTYTDKADIRGYTDVDWFEYKPIR